MLLLSLFCFGGLMIADSFAAKKIDLTNIPPYVKQCHESDPMLIQCFISSLHHLKPYLAKGIPEIDLPTVEPFRMDSIKLSLGSGPRGYRVELTDIDIYGASNFTVDQMKLSVNGKPFEAKIHLPVLKIKSKYASSGILFVLPASGSGVFHAIFEDSIATVKGHLNANEHNNMTYLHVDKLNVDLVVDKLKMGIKRVIGINRFITEATNLFLQENGQEVLDAMAPQLRKELSIQFRKIANQLLTHVPVQAFYVNSS